MVIDKTPSSEIVLTYPELNEIKIKAAIEYSEGLFKKYFPDHDKEKLNLLFQKKSTEFDFDFDEEKYKLLFSGKIRTTKQQKEKP